VTESEQPRDPDDATSRLTEVERQRRLTRVFGDVLPETTSDDRVDGERGPAADEWLRRQVPPHHG